MDRRHNPPKFSCPHCGWVMPRGALKGHVRSKHEIGNTGLAARFWAKVDKSPQPLGCWIWKGARSISRYGTFCWRGTNINAHRAAYLLTYGSIEPGLDVLHTCHNGIGGCVNPSHLYLGDDAQNIRDKIAAGRNQKRYRKLRAEEARSIRAAKGVVRAAELAKLHGVTIRSIHGVWAGRSWKDA